MFTEIGAVIRDFSGRTGLAYAGDLARLMDAHLVGYVEHGSSGDAAAQAQVIRRAAHVVAGTAPGARSRVRLMTDAVAQMEIPAGALLVGNGLSAVRRDVSVLEPFDEPRVFGRGTGEVMIPLGAGQSGRRAFRVGIPLAARLGVPVLFWHATWKDPDIGTDFPDAHVSPAARRTITDAQDSAAANAVTYRTVVETADAVVAGLSRCALAEHCALVVMARGRQTAAGHYGETLLRRTLPVPLLMVGDGEGRR